MRITKQTKYIGNKEFFELFQKMIKDTSKGSRKKKDGSRIRISTIDNYIYVQKQLLDFVTTTGYEIRIYLVDHLTTKEKNKAEVYYEKFYKQFTDYLYNTKDFYDNYIGLVIKGLRTFFNYLNTVAKIPVGNFHKNFYVPHEEVDIVVLSPEQLNYLIYDTELNAKLPEHLKEVKDIFVFGCTVALRYSDLVSLKPSNLHYYNNAHYLKVTSAKTNTNTTIKLPPYAVDILMKYHKQQKTLLPLKSNAWLNKCLKQLAAHLDFNEPIIKYRTKRNVKCVVYKNKEKRTHFTMADHITTHTMRRTAITTMLRLGMPDVLVRKISGHSATSKEFFRYVEFAQTYVDEHTDMVFDKIEKIEVQKSVFS